MTPTPLTEARNRLSEIVDEATATGSEIVITRHGRPAAVVMGYQDYESLIETLNILSDTETMRALTEAEGDLASGNLFEL
ncbi:MAG: type II toxin-antitoxin system Phd/YefM family antitoxin [bacterium]|nr:type II toxin-antitoxin system Phd/YefM family antitoxin [Acidimicrobiia bacterium]MCY4648958.1 type II toxin-antitoxin system Phd/YefM family antitoxin [bacterium]